MRGLVDWFFRDRTTGAIVIGQWPNLPLWLFAGFSLARWIAEISGAGLPGTILILFDLAARVSLVWWALDELFRGANPWRRCLGAGVVLLALWSAGVAVWSGRV